MRTLPPTTGVEFNRSIARRVRALEMLLGPLARDSTYPSDQRPDPAIAHAGSRIFDTGLGKPLWCNGTAWVDATGTPV